MLLQCCFVVVSDGVVLYHCALAFAYVWLAYLVASSLRMGLGAMHTVHHTCQLMSLAYVYTRTHHNHTSQAQMPTYARRLSCNYS